MSEIPEDVERVARALYADTMSRWRSPLALQSEGWKEFIPAARAAIEAMQQAALQQQLYDSEINVSTESFWDAGWELKLGDRHNGFIAEGRAKTWAEAETWLRDKAIEHYPDSEFARKR